MQFSGRLAITNETAVRQINQRHLTRGFLFQVIANGKGTNERVYQVEDFNNLTEIVERLQSEINYMLLGGYGVSNQNI